MVPDIISSKAPGESGNWVDGQTFTVNIDGLSYGTYTFNITVVDLDGNTISDTVSVSVIDVTTEEDSTANDSLTKLIIGGVAGVVGLVGITVMVLIKRRKSLIPKINKEMKK